MTVGGTWWNRQQHFAEIGEGNAIWPLIIDTARESDVEWYIVARAK